MCIQVGADCSSGETIQKKRELLSKRGLIQRLIWEFGLGSTQGSGFLCHLGSSTAYSAAPSPGHRSCWDEHFPETLISLLEQSRAGSIRCPTRIPANGRVKAPGCGSGDLWPGCANPGRLSRDPVWPSQYGK